MDIQIVIRNPDQGLVHHLLDTVREMGEPLSLVQMRPMGILIPIRLALKAGLLELPQSSEQAPEAGKSKPPRQRRSPRKTVEEADSAWEE